VLKGIMERLFGRGGAKPPELPKQAVEFDGIDRMVFEDLKLESPRFNRMVLDAAPIITPDASEPDPIDFTSATPEEITAWQEKVKAAREARAKADPYNGWEQLARDMFTYFHHAKPPTILEPDAMDPGFADHSKIMQAFGAQPEASEARNETRDDEMHAAMATMASVNKLIEVAGPILEERFRDAQALQEQMEQAQDAMEELESLRERAREARQEGRPITQNLKDHIKDAVKDKRAAQQAAAELAQNLPPAMTTDLYEAIQQAAVAGQEAAQQSVPGFGQGFGKGEPVYESPEQALAIAEQWQGSPLCDIAQFYGRMAPEFDFQRAKRVVGGQDEIVDVEVGDELRRVTPGELTFLADEDTEDDFYSRYASRELLVYSTVGEEHAGRGPMILVCDGSGSMSGIRNTWTRALFLALLNVARREKRDCAFIEFASAGQVIDFTFRHRDPLDPQKILDAASHFFSGGTTPIIGVQRAVEIMRDSPEFKTADLIIISDGEAGFGPEDQKLKDWLLEKGVRLHGIGIGRSFGYLQKMTDPETLVSVHDMELDDPNAATNALAVGIT
jgi:uncharacterized protein with von Willebrand factor type A (vWA) domain